MRVLFHRRCLAAALVGAAREDAEAFNTRDLGYSAPTTLRKVSAHAIEKWACFWPFSRRIFVIPLLPRLAGSVERNAATPVWILGALQTAGMPT